MNSRKFEVCIVVIGILLVVVLGSACGKRKFNSLAVSDDNVEDIKTNLVKIENYTEDGGKITGTGFFKEDGVLLTTSNVADKPGNMIATYSDGTKVSAEMFSNDIQTNTALLSVDDPQSIALNMKKEDVNSSTKENERMIAIGYLLDSDETVAIDVITESIEIDDTQMIKINSSLPQSFDGAVLIKDNGNVAGQVVLASSRLDYSLAATNDFLNKKEEQLMRVQSKKVFSEDTRRNIYTDFVAENGGDEIDILYQGDDYLYGSVITDNGLQLSVNQPNLSLVKVQFSTINCTDSLPFVLDGDTQPLAVATTDKGDFEFPLPRIFLQDNDQGEILLYFQNLTGIIRKITFNGVQNAPGEAIVIEVSQSNEVMERSETSIDTQSESLEK